MEASATITIRTIACSCSLSARPRRRWRTKANAPSKAPAGGVSACGSGMGRVLDAAFGRQIDSDRGARTDIAGDIERSAVELRQFDGERKPEAGARVGEP